MDISCDKINATTSTFDFLVVRDIPSTCNIICRIKMLDESSQTL